MWPLFTVTACFDVDDLCFPFACLARISQRFIHKYTYSQLHTHRGTRKGKETQMTKWDKNKTNEEKKTETHMQVHT